MHLEGHSPCAGLAFTRAGCVLTEVGEVFASDAFGEMFLEVLCAAVVNEDLKVHLGFAAQFIYIALELTLVGTDGLAQNFIVIEYGSKAEWKNGGVLKTVRDDAGVIYAGFLIQTVIWVMLADNDREIAGGI